MAYSVATWLQDFNELEDILEKRSTYRFDGFDREADPVQTAAKARAFLKLDGDCDCVPDICDLMEECGIKICFRTSALKQFFGLSVGIADEGPLIAVNNESSIPVERQIFSVAHELGHLLMHADTYTDGVTIEPKNAETEREADIFASYFLMPDDRFNKVWEEYRGLHWVDRILHVKRHFKVSYKTVIRRLIDTDRADPRKVYFMFNSAFQKRYGKKLGSKDEPGVPSSLKDEPRHLDPLDMVEDRLSGLLRDALEAEEISVSRAAEIMGKSLSEMREFVQSWKVVG